MSSYEIEIKSLLGSAEKADSLKGKLKSMGAKLTGSNKQLNHYFILHNSTNLKTKLFPYIHKNDRSSFEKILDEGKNVSVRTRDSDGKVLLVIKASIDDSSSSNGVSRMEFESTVGMSLTELDSLLIEAGLEYQAKWSRDREEYELNDINVCLDRNAGYGYLAEFEKISRDASESNKIKDELRALMKELDVEELPQNRLERMFIHYNTNWRDFYGTNKIFNIE